MAQAVAENPSNESTVWVAEGKNHNAVNRDLGKPGDAMNDVVVSFVRKSLARDGGTMPVDAGSPPLPPDAARAESGVVGVLEDAGFPAVPTNANVGAASVPAETPSPACSAVSSHLRVHNGSAWWWYAAFAMLVTAVLARRK